MTDLEAIAKDAAERVHKNGGCVPQLSFAPILFALQDALSARPLALGGQQGVQERCQRCGGEVQGWLCQSCPAEFRENDDGHLVFDEDTTPARAEAQDEGAAGEPVAWRYRSHPDSGWIYTGLGGQHDGCEVEPLYAHPSPTPAADPDRVREALTDLVSWFDKPVQGERGMVWVIRAGDQGADDAVAEARAALKSESRS